MMTKSASQSKRILSLFLALILMLGMIPISGIEAKAADSIPSTVTLENANYSAGARKGTTYTSTFSEIGTANMHYFAMGVNGNQTVGFCLDHNKHLGNVLAGTTWDNPTPTTLSEVAQRFLTYYYYKNELHQKAHAETGTNCTADSALKNDERYSGFWGEFELNWANALFQAVVWKCKTDPSFDPIHNEADKVALAKERQVIAKAIMGLPASYDEHYANIGYIIDAIGDNGWMIQQGIHYDFYEYSWKTSQMYPYSDKRGVQSVVVAVRDADPTGDPVYVKVRKVDGEGNALSGAVFTVYEDSAATHPVRKNSQAISTVDEWTIIGPMEPSASLGDSFTLYVKETNAPSGYKTDGSVQAVQVNRNTNNTPETAAACQYTFVNTQKTSKNPDGVVRKVDKNTGEGVGPATFRFLGQSDSGRAIDAQFTSDIYGSLELNWWQPGSDNYIEPGHYTVTETVPPTGYEGTNEAYNLTLTYDDNTGDTSHTGPIVFKNAKQHTVIIKKTDASGNGLAGATFDLYRNTAKVTSLTTGVDGTVTYEGPDGAGVESGTYTVIETKAPAGYLLPRKNWQEISVDAEDGSTYIHEFNFTNYEYPEIVITKTAAGTNRVLAGATFEVMVDAQKIGEYKTGVDGSIVIDYGTYGEYLTEGRESWTISVRETQAPDGYLLNDPNWHTAEMKQGETLKTFEFEDTEYPEIVILKVDAETGEPLANTSFLVKIDGATLGTYKTDANGKIAIDYETYARFLDEDNFDNWTITVTETEMPEGYNKDKQQASGDYTLTKQLKFGQSLVEFLFKDTSFRSINVTKRDAETGWALDGATFTLKSTRLDDPSVGTIEREGQTKNGCILFKDLPNGTYVIAETIAPSGYELPNPNFQTIHVTSDSDNIIEVEFKDYPKEGLLIRKEDSVTKQPLPGTKFEVKYLGKSDTTDGATNGSREYVTDENGLIYLPDCSTGWYQVTEVSVPDGYVLDTEPRLVEIVNTHVPTTITFSNYQDGQLVVLKKDSQTGLPLANALFKVTTAGGNFIATIETGANGYATLDGLQPGSYTVTEVEAPDGHLVDPTPQSFEIRKGQTEPVFLIFYNDGKTNLYIRKEDAQTHIGLEGAVYKVTKIDGYVVKERLTTGEDGLAALTDLDPGNYKVTEIEAPKGYLLNSTPQTISIEAGQTKSMLFRNNKPGGIALLKTDTISGLPLSGAKYNLYSVDDKLLGSYTTGTDGYIRVSDLDAGFYFLQETEAPEGYLLDSAKHKVEVKNFNVTQVNLTNTEKASLNVIKIAKGSKIPLAGAEFGIYDMHGSLIKTITTDASGMAGINSLTPGWYRVKETVAPTGYILDTEEHLVEVVDGKPATLTVTNIPQSGITVKKVDATTQTPLPGAVFELRTVEDRLLGTYTTDASGAFVTDNVDPGTYFLIEKKAPEGYIISEESTKVTVHEDEHPIVTIENHKGTTIQILKTDSVTGDYLAGAEFEVWTLNCAKLLGTYVTDKTGMVYSDPLPAGNYVVKESKAPAGYVLDKTHHHVNLGYDHPYILKVSNQPMSGIMITKVSTVDDTPLMGAKFEVKTAEGKVVGEYTTDTTGTATTPVLEPGVYYVQEVEAPDGYLINSKIFTVEVTAGKLATLVVEDSPEASLVIFKGDSSTKKGIAGAVFKVETADGDFIGTYTTDAQGEALIRPIAPGHYIVTEMSAPEGYLVNESPKTITVKVGVVNRVEFMDAAKGSLIIRLEDQSDGHKLENGRFELYWAATGEKVAEGVTDNSGSIVWGDLTPGRYTIKQTYAPDGYTIVDTEKDGIVVAGDTKIVVFKDCTSGLVIEKLDKQTLEPLAGARFQVIRNSDNIVIGEYVTDNDGLSLVSGLVPGMYTVEELVAPAGYAIDESFKLVQVKANESAHITFTDTPYGGITVNAVDKDNNNPLSGVVVEVWHQNGELVNTFTTDSTGTIQTDKLSSGYYVIKVIKTENGYTAVTSEQTVEIKNGDSVTVKFEFIARGMLQVMALNNSEQGLPGMKVTVTKQNGEFVGNYTTDSYGSLVVTNLEAGWYIVTETSAPDGYTINGDNSQSVQVDSNGEAFVAFYHGKTYGLQIRTSVKQTGAMVPGITYQITTLDGSVVGTYTSDKSGLAFATLEPGWYVVKQTGLPSGYKNYSLCASRNVEVGSDQVTVISFQLGQQSSMRVKFVDGLTDRSIYGVRVLLKDETGSIVDEYTSNNEGYITIKQNLTNGSYTLEQISVPSGYTVDTVPKALEILNGETTEIVWKMYTDAGQIQVHVTASAYNATLDQYAGTNLQGAVFEVYDPFTYEVVATMTSDSYGVAASNGLPIGRYIVREKSPAPYYGLSGKETEVYLKIKNDVVRVEYQQAPLTLKTTLTMKSNQSVRAGTSQKFVFTAVNNDSSDRLDNFFWAIKVPTDAMRAGTLYTGKWSHSVFYSISYKTNMNDYRTLATGLNSSNAYQYDLSSLAINVQGGEYVTDIRFEFGTVPAGFKPTTSPVFYGYVMPGVVNGYKVIMRSECGGKYSEAWSTASSLWTTSVISKVKANSTSYYPNSLPKLGY